MKLQKERLTTSDYAVGVLYLPLFICWWNRTVSPSMYPPFSLWMHWSLASDKSNLPTLQI